jgi:hypothetical protein
LLLFLSCGDKHVLSYAWRTVRLIHNRSFFPLLQDLQTGSGPHPASCSVSIGGLSLGNVAVRMCGTIPPDLNDVHRNDFTFISFAQICVTLGMPKTDLFG